MGGETRIMSQYEVPKGMLKAAVHAMKYAPERFGTTEDWARIGLEAALCWISENPRVPTRMQMMELETAAAHEPKLSYRWLSDVLTGWQRICWRKPESEMPEEVKDLVWNKTPGAWPSPVGEHTRIHNEQILEAYRRGRERRKKEEAQP